MSCFLVFGLEHHCKAASSQRFWFVNIIFLKVQRWRARCCKLRLFNIFTKCLCDVCHQKVLDISISILLLVLLYLLLGIIPVILLVVALLLTSLNIGTISNIELLKRRFLVDNSISSHLSFTSINSCGITQHLDVGTRLSFTLLYLQVSLFSQVLGYLYLFSFFIRWFAHELGWILDVGVIYWPLCLI